MNFGLSQTQTLLQQSTRQFLERAAPMEEVRRILDGGTPDPALRKGMAEQGLLGLLIPEAHSGLGLGLLDAVVVAQELGRQAAPLSFHAEAVLTPLLLRHFGGSERAASALEGIATGEAILTTVLEGPPPTAEGTLVGDAGLVPSAASADALLVESDGHLFLLEGDADGLRITPRNTIDGTRELSDVSFEGVRVAERELGRLSAEEISRALQATRIALAADAYGAARTALEMAVAYARERRQFERVIGSFQGVKHLLAETVAELDPVQSLLWYAAFAWDEELEESVWLAPLLKAHVGEVTDQTVTNTTQVYGGMGFTWECDMHIFYKRVAYGRQVLGRPEAMRARAAELQFGAAG